MQQTIDFGNSVCTSEKEAVEYLRSLGYVVIKRDSLEGSWVKTPSDLVNYFYSLLQFYNQDRKIHYSPTKKDLRQAKNLIKSRLETAGNKERALKEATSIVRCVAKYEEHFKFTSPIHSFDCFGQDTMRWVTDKAIGIINKEEQEIEDERLRLYINALYIEQEKEALNFVNESKIEELKHIYGGLTNGEKEKNR